tara:strand:+ start:206 stop:691 length:486 start_codon:yes stop_codon:yes gene_type:complete
MPKAKKIIDCKKCNRTIAHYAKGFCNTCYKKDREYRNGPSWLNNCQRCGRPFTQAQHRHFGLCGRCYTNLEKDQLDYWAGQFELNRPDRNDRLKTPENRTALKLARMVGASAAAKLVDVHAEDFKQWASNREAVPARWKKKLRIVYLEQMKTARLRDAMVT